MEFLQNLSEGYQFLIQLIIVLICLFYGARKGGVALGMLGGIGLIVLVFCFGMNVGKPAISVMLVILAVVVASATLQASGGLDVMLQIAEKVLRKNPKYISILAPFVSATLTVLCGTGHTVYTLLPIVYDIAIKNNIRPERPMAATTVSAQMGIIASPVSVAVVSLTAFLLGADTKLANFDGYLDLLKITIPSTYFGVLCIGIFSWFRGKDLDKDEEFQAKIKDPEQRAYIYGSDENATLLGKKLPGRYWAAMWIFLGTIAVVAVLGYNKELRPSWPTSKDAASIQIKAGDEILQKISVKDATISLTNAAKNSEITFANNKVKKETSGTEILTAQIKDKKGNVTTIVRDGDKVTLTDASGTKEFTNAKIVVNKTEKSSKTLDMVNTIQIFMLLAGALILIFTKAPANKIASNEIFRSGMVALVAVYGISWMAETMFGAHTPMMKEYLGGIVTEHPWTYAAMLLLVSKFVNSQAAALAAFVPLALTAGVSPALILAFAPACYGYYILPTYPSDLAGIQFDRSGTTHIGKFVINHSFIIPGLIGVISSCIVGYFLANLYGYL